MRSDRRQGWGPRVHLCGAHSAPKFTGVFLAAHQIVEVFHVALSPLAGQLRSTPRLRLWGAGKRPVKRDHMKKLVTLSFRRNISIFIKNGIKLSKRSLSTRLGAHFEHVPQVPQRRLEPGYSTDAIPELLAQSGLGRTDCHHRFSRPAIPDEGILSRPTRISSRSDSDRMNVQKTRPRAARSVYPSTLVNRLYIIAAPCWACPRPPQGGTMRCERPFIKPAWRQACLPTRT